jgi:hypothetical protein
MQQQIRIIDACEKYRTRVSFIEHDLRHSTRILSNHHDDDAQKGDTRQATFRNVRMDSKVRCGTSGSDQIWRAFYHVTARNRQERIFRDDSGLKLA